MGLLELLILIAVVVFFFGGKKLPEAGTGLGKAIRNFKAALKDDERAPGKEPPAPPPPGAPGT